MSTGTTTSGPTGHDPDMPEADDSSVILRADIGWFELPLLTQIALIVFAVIGTMTAALAAGLVVTFVWSLVERLRS